jgi:hypothetical protein
VCAGYSAGVGKNAFGARPPTVIVILDAKWEGREERKPEGNTR